MKRRLQNFDALYHNFPQLNVLLARFNSLPDFSPEDVKLLAQDVAIYGPRRDG
ncbi:Uncharacterised protein [Klebsiella michiganensis]|uniref:Uncharacterized protein n=1 Tax=Klebsiella michiganensis TaxID=1134687 RepID=A0A7H4MYM6_9ENTR|nr:Uncharacterised protein [Klebsiella michiganensis]